MITITAAAHKQIAEVLAKRGHGIGIKIGVKTTGCSGLAYVLEYVDSMDYTENTVNYSLTDFCVLVSLKDEPYLKGLTMDWVRAGLNTGFDFQNPNERDRCGCGESFRV
jgi:iron-sulfur cluster assembly protein